jgi:hypothetical protein
MTPEDQELLQRYWVAASLKRWSFSWAAGLSMEGQMHFAHAPSAKNQEAPIPARKSPLDDRQDERWLVPILLPTHPRTHSRFTVLLLRTHS